MSSASKVDEPRLAGSPIVEDLTTRNRFRGLGLNLSRRGSALSFVIFISVAVKRVASAAYE